MIPGYSDQKVIEMIQHSPASREDIFGLLFLDRALRNKAFSAISKMINDGTTVEDLFLDGLLQLIKSIRKNKFEGRSSLTTYFVSMCKMLALRHVDSSKRERYNFDNYQSTIQSNTQVADYNDHLLFALEEPRYEARLKRRIYKKLSANCRLYFRQKYGKLMTIKEMALSNVVREQSVKNTLSRCYQKVRELVKNDPEVMAKIQANYGKF